MRTATSLAAISAATVARQGPVNTERLREAAKYDQRLINVALAQINELKIYLNEEEPLAEAGYARQPTEFALSYLLPRYRNELMEALDNAFSMDYLESSRLAWARYTVNVDAFIQNIIKIDVNIADHEGKTTLMWAVRHIITEGFDVTTRLLRAGARVDARDVKGHTAVDVALAIDHSETRNQTLNLLKEYK